MKPTRCSIGVVWFCVAWVAGCSAKVGGGIMDPSTFAGMNAAAIRFDCTETRACLDQLNMKPATNFIDTCVKKEADKFSGMPQTQAEFLSKSRRCAPFGGCEYYNCTQRSIPPSSFSVERAPQITYGCQQKVQCETEQGKKFDDPMIAVNNCVGATQGTFFNFGIAEQNGYDSAFSMCSMLSGCPFVTCYSY